MNLYINNNYEDNYDDNEQKKNQKFHIIFETVDGYLGSPVEVLVLQNFTSCGSPGSPKFHLMWKSWFSKISPHVEAPGIL